jgi:hypothetical protein
MSDTETIDAPCALCGCNHPEIAKLHEPGIGPLCEECRVETELVESRLLDSGLRPMTRGELKRMNDES